MSAAGETVASPGALMTITSSTPTAIAPGTKVSVGAGLPPGGYFYGVTHVLASGETAVSGDGAAACTRFLGTSSVAPGLRAWPSLSTNLGAIGHQMEARLAYRSSTSLAPATLGPTSGRVTLVASTTGQPSGLEVSFNLSLPTSANYLDVQVRNVTTGGAWGTVQTYSNVGGGGHQCRLLRRRRVADDRRDGDGRPGYGVGHHHRAGRRGGRDLAQASTARKWAAGRNTSSAVCRDPRKPVSWIRAAIARW